MVLIFFLNHIDLSNTPVLYKVKKKRKIINAIIANAVIRFFSFCFFIRCNHIILSIKKRTKIKNKYNIEYPNIAFATLGLNLFFLNFRSS